MQYVINKDTVCDNKLVNKTEQIRVPRYNLLIVIPSLGVMYM